MEEYAEARRHLKAIGLNSNMWNNVVVAKAALDRGVDVRSRPSKRGMTLVHGARRHFWHIGSTSLNSVLANRVANYKDVTSRMLNNRGVKAPENAVFSIHEVERAWSWAGPILPVVLKPVNSLRGQNVHVNICTYDEFLAAFKAIAGDDGSPVLVEQFHLGIERRCLVVDDQLVAVLERRPANVVGDGLSSIRELVDSKNLNRPGIHKNLSLGDEELKKLTGDGLTPDSVPAAGQTVFIRSNLNLHSGGDLIDWTQDVSDAERKYVEDATRAIPGLRMAGLDVLFPREGKGNEPIIIEINHNPQVSMHHFPLIGQPRDAAGAIVRAMFPGLEA